MLKDFKKLRHQIQYYHQKMSTLKKNLAINPEDWGKYQNEFNGEVDLFFKKILDYERLHSKESARVEKLKNFFIKYFRKIFYQGDYSKWTIDKPLGYAGDFKIMEDIYRNSPKTVGYERLFDNYFQMSAISIAVRNRRDDLKANLRSFARSFNGQQIRIMNLACGAAREIKELFDEDFDEDKKWLATATFDCVDFENKALYYAKNLLCDCPNVNIIRENVLRLAITKNVTKLFNNKYHFIYSLGLFDYLNRRTCIKLLKNLRELLHEQGVLFIANVRDRYYNPSVFYMEWAGDWNLTYKDDQEFKSLFIEAGFSGNKIKRLYEQQGVLQYIKAQK